MWNEIRPNRHYSEHSFNCLSYRTYWQQNERNFVLSFGVLYSVRGKKQNNKDIHLYQPYIKPDICASRAARLKTRTANTGVVIWPRSLQRLGFIISAYQPTRGHRPIWGYLPRRFCIYSSRSIHVYKACFSTASIFIAVLLIVVTKSIFEEAEN
jgi:hypothetical protein